MNTPAIIVIGYNRPMALTRLLESLEKAVYPNGINVPLIISIDKSDSNDTVEAANAATWTHGTKTVQTYPANLGLRNHVIKCGDWAAEYGSIIVLEDDLYVSRGFYEYAVAALDWTGEDDRIGGVSLYNHLLNVHAREPFEAVNDGYDNWYFQFASSWGQAYTARQWAQFKEWYAVNCDKRVEGADVPQNVAGWSDKSWLKYYIKYLIDTNKYFMYPRISYSTNFSDAGEHFDKADTDTDVQVPFAMDVMHRDFLFSSLDESQAVYDAFFENVRLPDDEMRSATIVDLYGTKDIGKAIERAGDFKYILTCKSLPYKVVKAYARVMRPIDANVLENVGGHDFYLYDLTQSGPAPHVNEVQRYLYNYRALNAGRMSKILKYRTKSIFKH